MLQGCQDMGHGIGYVTDMNLFLLRITKQNSISFTLSAAYIGQLDIYVRKFQ